MVKLQKFEIQGEMQIWLVYSNTDLTERRGKEYIKHICKEKVTAIRYSKGAYVRGSDAPIRQGLAYKIDGAWFYPGEIIFPSKEDIESQKELDLIESIVKKARDAGLTDDDIKKLSDLKK